MGKGNKALKKQTRQGRRHRRLLLLFLAAILGLGGYFFVTDFSIRTVEIKGNDTYAGTEILQEMKKDGYVGNTLLMIAQNQIFGQTYLPFVDEITMSYADDSHVLKVKVKEKLRPGAFAHKDQYMYFDENGIVVESRNTLYGGVPVITGVKTGKMELTKEIQVGDAYLHTIVSITKKIATYGLTAQEIHFDGADKITLTAGKYEIYLGDSAYLDGKMARLSSILSALSEESKAGKVDMHLYTDDNPIVTYKATKKQK